MRKTLLLAITLLLSVGAVFAQENVKRNQYGVAVNSDVLDVEAQDGITVFESQKSGYKFWFDGRAQVDGAVFFGKNSKDYDQIGNGVSIRRARFAVKAQVTNKWYGEFDMDLANGLVELKDAIVRYTGVKNLELQAGNFKENFSMQRNTSSRYLMFMERPMVTSALAPSRHLGINAKYADKWFWGSIGAFSQEVAGSEEWTNVADNNKDYGRDAGYSITTKVVFRPLYKLQDASLHIGFAASYRRALTSVEPSAWGMYRASARNSTSINRKKYLDTDNLPGFDHNWLWTVELAGHWQGLRYEMAWIGDNVHFKKSAADNAVKNFGGGYIQASYLLCGGSQRYDANGGKYTKVRYGRKWGDLEIAGRYEYCDLNSKTVYGGSSEAYTIGLNWWIYNNVKFMINYQHNNNDRYANGKGKLFVGHDADGKPTKDYTQVVEKKGKAGVDYNMISVRLEINF